MKQHQKMGGFASQGGMSRGSAPGGSPLHVPARLMAPLSLPGPRAAHSLRSTTLCAFLSLRPVQKEQKHGIPYNWVTWNKISAHRTNWLEEGPEGHVPQDTCQQRVCNPPQGTGDGEVSFKVVTDSICNKLSYGIVLSWDLSQFRQTIVNICMGNSYGEPVMSPRSCWPNRWPSSHWLRAGWAVRHEGALGYLLPLNNLIIFVFFLKEWGHQLI